MYIALVNIVTDKQIDFANLQDLKMWIETHRAFLSKKQIERFVLHRAEPAPYRNYIRCAVLCSLRQFINKHKLL